MDKKRIHFVYAHGPQRSCPYAISNELSPRLEAVGYEVIQHQWDEIKRVRPSCGDILLGHPNGLPFTTFRSSFSSQGWSRKLILYPYSHGRLDHSSFMDGMLPDCDLLLAITGKYWFRRVRESKLAHWAPKMRHLDLAINRTYFPLIKTSFNSAGKRRLVYIGGTSSYKNTPYLEDLARVCGGIDFGWIGPGRGSIRGFRKHGLIDFQTPDGKDAIRNYDFLITAGNSDANPTTILEAMAWGLIPVCSPQSGYEEDDGVVNIPLGNPEKARRILRHLQEVPTEWLFTRQTENLRRLDTHFNWDRFAQQVVSYIEGADSPQMGKQSLANKLVIRANMLFTSERTCLFRPRVMKRFAVALVVTARNARNREAVNTISQTIHLQKMSRRHGRQGSIRDEHLDNSTKSA